MKGKFQVIMLLFLVFFLFSALTIPTLALSKKDQSENMERLENKERWIDKPQSEWPQIAMINHIEYSDKSHPIAGCSFLLDTGNDILAVTAKHVLTYFKSEKMDSVSFKDTLKSWKMYPKNNSADMVIVDTLINENRDEPIEEVPPEKDWLLFSIKDKSENIQPLKFRTEPFQHGEKVYIVGWRYTDKDGTQRIYEGNYVRSLHGSLLISTEILADNTMPGLSGAPVIDSNGDLIGIMSHKHHKMEHLSSIDYPKQVLKRRSALGSVQESQPQQGKQTAQLEEAKPPSISYQGKTYPLSPDKIDVLPAIPSPFTTEEGMEVVVSHTKDEKYIIIPVTLQSEDPGKRKSYTGNQRKVDAEDFPALAQTGLHSEIELDMVKTITGRSIAEITSLAKPGGLSSDGFLAPDEDIISVIKADNRLVKKLGLTHPDMAKPLFHLFNLTEENFRISNFLSYESHHAVYPSYLYNGKKIFVEIEYTKGGQESIFDDGITGALAITIRRELDQKEKDFLDAKYAHLSEEQRNDLKDSLSRIFTGEMEAFYIMRYGFYEGHTEWRTDPLAIASVFGLKSIEEIEKAFPGKIHTALTEHFTAH